MSDGRARPWGLDNTKYHEEKKNRCTCRIFPLKISPEKLNRPSLQNSFRLCSIPAEALRLVNEPKHLRLSLSKEFKRFESLHAIKNKTKNFGMFFSFVWRKHSARCGRGKGLMYRRKGEEWQCYCTGSCSYKTSRGSSLQNSICLSYIHWNWCLFVCLMYSQPPELWSRAKLSSGPFAYYAGRC